MEAIVSDILQSRKREPEGLKKTAAISLGAHAAAIALILVIPSVIRRAAQPPRVVMNISLGGAPGPNTGGMQMIGGRPIQVGAALKRAADPGKARSARGGDAPEDGLAGSKAEAADATQARPAVEDPKGTAVGRGFETQPGRPRSRPGRKARGWPLNRRHARRRRRQAWRRGSSAAPRTPGHPGPDHQKNWKSESARAAGVVVMKYMIQRNGQITDIEVGTSSGKCGSEYRRATRADQHAGARAAARRILRSAAAGRARVRVHQIRATMKQKGSELLRCGGRPWRRGQISLRRRRRRNQQQPPTPAAEKSASGPPFVVSPVPLRTTPSPISSRSPPTRRR